MSPSEKAREECERPFDPAEIKWKPQSVKGSRALAIAYVDARVVAERLDDVFGTAGWEDSYTHLEDGSAVCTLRCKIGGEWVTKQDVGSPSEQPDPGDRRKASVSDALKRAAVKFGIGRYLYRLPHQWCDYDGARRALTQVPKLPAWALPADRPEPTINDESITDLIKLAASKGYTVVDVLRAAKVDAMADLEAFTLNQGKALYARLEAAPDKGKK